MQTVAVVLAGGSGERFGTSVPKQLLPFAGRPLIEHSVAAFDEAPAVDSVLVVMAARHAGQVREVLAGGGYRKLAGVIPGGPSRVESTRCAIGDSGVASLAGRLWRHCRRSLSSSISLRHCTRSRERWMGYLTSRNS